MPLAHEVATELRKFAARLDSDPEAEVVRPSIYMSHSYQGDNAKGMFLALAKMLPHPLAKQPEKIDYNLIYESDAMKITSYIERTKICTLIEPAKEAVYECEPLFSEAEEENLGVEVQS